MMNSRSIPAVRTFRAELLPHRSPASALRTSRSRGGGALVAKVTFCITRLKQAAERLLLVFTNCNKSNPKVVSSSAGV